MERLIQSRKERKASTRRNLIMSSQKLFAAKGYDGTTLEEIAEDAGLHVQTLYRHFANKAELLNAGDEERLNTFRIAIRSRKQTDCTFKFWRNWVEDAIRQFTPPTGRGNYREALMERKGPEPYSAVGVHYEDLLAESLCKDYPLADVGTGLSLTRLAAISLRGVNTSVLRSYTKDCGFDLITEAVAAVDSVEAIYRPLLEATISRKF